MCGVLIFHIAFDHMCTSNFFLPPTVTFPGAISKKETVKRTIDWWQRRGLRMMLLSILKYLVIVTK